MLKKKSQLIKFSVFLLALAPTIAYANSTVWIGEPKLPKKLENTKNI
jgi:hypothetical protein